MEEVYLHEIPEGIDAWKYLNNYVNDQTFALCFVYDSSFSNTPRLRSLMETLFDIFSLEPKDKNRLVLVSDELNNNAVEHGNSWSGKNKMAVVIERKWKNLYVNIEVTDCWEGKAEYMQKLKSEKDAIWFEKHHGIRGRGLFLITERIADKLYFKDAEWGGLIVWIEKTL